jgi:hypothetical protein
LLWVLTLVLCLVAFVFYRAENLEQSFRILSAMSGTATASLPFRLSDADLLIAAIVLEGLVITHWLCRHTSLEAAVGRVPWWTVSVGVALMLVAITLSSGESQSFLYFQY